MKRKEVGHPLDRPRHYAAVDTGVVGAVFGESNAQRLLRHRFLVLNLALQASFGFHLA